MTPLPENPTVMIRLDERGLIAEVATNVATNLRVVISHNKQLFDKAAAGQPFHRVLGRMPDPVPAPQVYQELVPEP